MARKDEKSSRITIACNTCRSRKQKCSGEKPVCKQCFNHNRPCGWPEQLRRGPPKGYVEALEHRLQATESAFLRLLSQVSDLQLLRAVPDQPASHDGSGASYNPRARLGKKGVEDWARFPLHTAENIREWQRACSGQVFSGSGNAWDVEASQSPVDMHEQRGRILKFGNTTSYAELSAFRNEHGGSPQPVFETHNHFSEIPHSIQEHTRRPPLDLSGLQASDVAWEEVQSMPTRSAWSGAPSFSFQERFLW